MFFTQINCAGKNIQWVHLGEKLVWQFSKELFLYGSGNIRDTASAVFRLTVQEYMAGGSKLRTMENTALKLVYSSQSAGDMAFAIDSQGASKLVKSLLLSAHSTEITTPEGTARLIPIKDLSVYGNIFRQAEQVNMMDINALLSQGLSAEKQSGGGGVKMIKAKDGSAEDSFSSTAGAVGWAIYVQKVNGLEHTSHSDHCVIVTVSPNQVTSRTHLKTFSAADGRVFPAQPLVAEGSFSEFAVALLRLSDVLDTDGRMFVFTHSTGGAITNPAQLSAGKSAQFPHSKGYTKRLKALISNGIGRHYTENTATSTLWWFPVGDGTVLEEGSEAQTKNGKVLEIQWAFDTVHHENGILEVI